MINYKKIKDYHKFKTIINNIVYINKSKTGLLSNFYYLVIYWKSYLVYDNI